MKRPAGAKYPCRVNNADIDDHKLAVSAMLECCTSLLTSDGNTIKTGLCV